jgi:hypothetical protein
VSETQIAFFIRIAIERGVILKKTGIIRLHQHDGRLLRCICLLLCFSEFFLKHIQYENEVLW